MHRATPGARRDVPAQHPANPCATTPDGPNPTRLTTFAEQEPDRGPRPAQQRRAGRPQLPAPLPALTQPTGERQQRVWCMARAAGDHARCRDAHLLIQRLNLLLALVIEAAAPALAGIEVAQVA